MNSVTALSISPDFHTFNVALAHEAWCFTFTCVQCVGGATEVAARALSVPDLQEEHGEQTASVEGLQRSQLEQEIAQVDLTLEDMEMKVNVLRWTVEARGPQYSELVSTDSASLSLLCTDDEEAQGKSCDRSQMFVVMLLGGVAVIAVVLSACVVLLV